MVSFLSYSHFNNAFMEKNDIRLDDWMRILFGNVPISFMFEVFIRTLVMYVLLLMVIRYLGKRMSGQLSVTELSVMLLLGAVVSSPMQLPDRGLLQGLWLLVIILVLQRGLTWIGARNAKIEKITQGEAALLVKDGIIDINNLVATRVSRPELFKEIRSKNIYQLGKVKRVYIEASGAMSIYEADNAKPGLSVLPTADKEIQMLNKEAGDNLKVCCCCGNTQTLSDTAHTACNVCNSIDWGTAVV